MAANDAVWLLVYLLPLLLIVATFRRRRVRRERRSTERMAASAAAGHLEPASLHPVLEPSRCIGCGACVQACPEGTVLGLIDGKVRLVDPSHCIGHGACKRACPFDAIRLVFGSAERGVDIPFVAEDFQTNVPGVFIAGELGGMGLIRNAIEQGRRAMESIARLPGMGSGADLDVVIVGAGPAGFSASLAAMERGLRFVTLEQESFGGTVAHYPRGKIVMTAPVKLPVIGKTRLRETTKEALLAFWQEVKAKTGLEIRFQERVDAVVAADGGFEVTTPRGVHRARAVLLTIGWRGTPRKLGVPGEELPKVVYRLVDPEQYAGRAVLVVGGGDAALEAATSIAAQPDTRVTLSYRSEAFSRAKDKNRERVRAAEATGRLRVLLKSQVKRIAANAVEVEYEGRVETLANDGVIVCAGGILPTKFLQGIGIEVETKYGTA